MKLTKKLFITIMTMALLVVTFSASTFAWFTLGTESEISNVKINVMAGKGMEISDDGINWKNNIQLASAQSEAIAFTALTTYNIAGNDNFRQGIDFYNDKGTKVTDGANASYFEKTFYIRITNRKGDLDNTTYSGENETKDFSYIDLTEVKGAYVDFSDVENGAAFTQTGDAKQWLADVEFGTYEAQKLYNFDPLNAVKVSFATTRDNKEVATVLFGYENQWAQGGVAYNGPAEQYASVKGYTLSLPVKTAGSGTDPDVLYTKDEAVLPTYVGFASLNAEDESSVNNTVAADAHVLAYSDFVELADLPTLKNILTTANQVTSGTPGEVNNFLYAKVTVRIWLDGWDADCINAILDKATSISFKLTAIE